MDSLTLISMAHGNGSTTCSLTSRELGLEEEYVAVLTALGDASVSVTIISVSLARLSAYLSFPHHDGPSTEKRLLPKKSAKHRDPQMPGVEAW